MNSVLIRREIDIYRHSQYRDDKAINECGAVGEIISAIFARDFAISTFPVGVRRS